MPRPMPRGKLVHLGRTWEPPDGQMAGQEAGLMGQVFGNPEKQGLERGPGSRGQESGVWQVWAQAQAGLGPAEPGLTRSGLDAGRGGSLE